MPAKCMKTKKTDKADKTLDWYIIALFTFGLIKEGYRPN